MPDLTPLGAAAAGDLGAARFLLSHRADVNTYEPVGVSPLTLAVTGRFDALARLLIEHGAEVNARDADGVTPLMVAVRVGDAAAVRLLLAHGAPV